MTGKAQGKDERGIDQTTGKTVIAIDPRYYRPTDVEWLLGDASKAQALLGWQPTIRFHELVKLMVEKDCILFEQNLPSKQASHSPIHTNLCPACKSGRVHNKRNMCDE